MNHKIKRVHQHIRLILGMGLLLGGILVGVMNVGQVKQLLTKAGGTPAEIEVKTQAVLGPLPRPWRNLAQGGESADYRFTEVINQVKSLHPEYIRIDHIYDFYEPVKRDGQGQLTFDWSKLDPVLDDIAQMGAKPFVSLSYMPPAISRGDIVDKPNNWGEWQLVIQRTIEHISGRSGKNISNVYYEVWNEPDLFGNWKTYGDKNYLELYRYAARGAMSVKGAQPFKFGGPAITAFYSSWADSLFDFVEKNNLRFDFFSWHRYHLDVEKYMEEAKAVDLALEKYPRLLLSVEKIISEWGLDSENNAGYDGNWAAAHMTAVMTELPVWVDKAFVFEIQDGKDPAGKEYWGRWGLITHKEFGSKAKPRFRAIALLEQLGDERLALGGKGSWVRGLAAKKETVIQTLLVNYDTRGLHVEKVPVTYSQVRPGEFVIKQKFLDGKLQTFNVATTEATLKHEVVMPASSIVFLELEQTKVVE